MINATMVAQGVRRLPFGIVVRANDVMEKIENYGFQGKRLTFIFDGQGVAPTIQEAHGCCYVDFPGKGKTDLRIAV